MLENGEVIHVGAIRLRRFRLEDARDIAARINDPEISRFTIQIPYPYGVKDAIDFISNNEVWFEEGSSLNLAITLKEEDSVIGGIGLMNIDRKFNHAEIGYWIGKEYWGKGMVSQCVQAMVRLGFDRIGLQRISAVVFSPNTRSKRILEKNGFKFEGTMRDRYILDGRPADGDIFGITRRDMERHLNISVKD